MLQRQKDYLRNGIFVGLVEENVDPLRQGRLKIRVQHVYEEIELDHIPWSSPYKDLAGKEFSVPAIGKIVNVIFPNGNIYEPYYIYAEKYNINLHNKLKEISDDEYKNFVALLFDHRTQIYSDDTELRLDYLYNNIKIQEQQINIHLKDNNQELHLGHDNSSQSAVLGDHLMQWFDEFMSTLLQPMSLLGNLGAPVLKPQLDQVILKYQALRQTFLSQHVKIVDNGGCVRTDKKRYDTPTEDDIIDINNEKLLYSKEISPEVKDKVVKQREKEYDKVEDSKPDPADDVEFNDLTLSTFIKSHEEYYSDNQYLDEEDEETIIEEPIVEETKKEETKKEETKPQPTILSDGTKIEIVKVGPKKQAVATKPDGEILKGNWLIGSATDDLLINTMKINVENSYNDGRILTINT